jgi:hypothetical protein
LHYFLLLHVGAFGQDMRVMRRNNAYLVGLHLSYNKLHCHTLPSLFFTKKYRR